MAADDKEMFRAEKKRTNRLRKADGNTCVTCPASRHAQMIAEAVGARRPYPMLHEEPEHCAGSILSAVGSLYEARLLLAKNLSLTQRETDALIAAAGYLEGDGVSMPTITADLIAATLRSIASRNGVGVGGPLAPSTKGGA